jgi:hypothetical protein
MQPSSGLFLSGSSLDPAMGEATFRIAATENASMLLAPLLCRIPCRRWQEKFQKILHSAIPFLTEPCQRAAESNVRSLARALARRDMTVPRGQSKILAIS